MFNLTDEQGKELLKALEESKGTELGDKAIKLIQDKLEEKSEDIGLM